MMRHFLLYLFIAFSLQLSVQTGNTNLTLEIDSLKKELVKPMSDSLRADILSHIVFNYMHINTDSTILYSERAIKFYEKTNNIRKKAFTTGQLMEAYIKLGNLPKALEVGLNTVRLIEESGIYKSGVGSIYDNLGLIYHYLGDNEKALQYYGKNLLRADVDILGVAFGFFGIAIVYESTNELDSALVNLDKSRDVFYKFNHSKNPDDINSDKLLKYEVYPAWYNIRSKVYIKQNKRDLALKNGTIQTDFDNTIEKINITPQDIGRVLLNLYNNAYYAVAEKIKQQGEGYKPIVSVSTKRVIARPDDPVGGRKVGIKVKDNGMGIPQKVVDKIFQPFFTTKPTGQGTGLGLSLAYDIIKAHGGEIKVETKEGEGSEFIIQLPLI